METTLWVRPVLADEFSRFADPWNELAGNMPFRRWEWNHAWWSGYGDSLELCLLAVESKKGELIGLAPWCIETSASRGRVLRLLGFGEACTDYVGVLAAPGRDADVATALADWLTGTARWPGRESRFSWDLLELEAIQSDDAVAAHLVERLGEAGCAVHSSAGPRCWRLAIPATWEEYEASISSSHRKQIRRCERRLETSGHCALRLAQDRESFQRGMKLLVELHQRRWQSLGQPGCFASPQFSKFLHEAAAGLFAVGQLQLAWLEVSKRPAAVEFQVLGDNMIYAYQGGVEPDLIDQEPGRMVKIALLKRAMSRQIRSLDFLRGDEPYKAHWRAEPRPTLNHLVSAPNATSRMRLSAWLAGGSVKQWVKSGLSLVGVR